MECQGSYWLENCVVAEEETLLRRHSRESLPGK
jgi:hypothetical protein